MLEGLCDDKNYGRWVNLRGGAKRQSGAAHASTLRQGRGACGSLRQGYAPGAKIRRRLPPRPAPPRSSSLPPPARACTWCPAAATCPSPTTLRCAAGAGRSSSNTSSKGRAARRSRGPSSGRPRRRQLCPSQPRQRPHARLRPRRSLLPPFPGHTGPAGGPRDLHQDGQAPRRAARRAAHQRVSASGWGSGQRRAAAARGRSSAAAAGRQWRRRRSRSRRPSAPCRSSLLVAHPAPPPPARPTSPQPGAHLGHLCRVQGPPGEEAAGLPAGAPRCDGGRAGRGLRQLGRVPVAAARNGSGSGSSHEQQHAAASSSSRRGPRAHPLYPPFPPSPTQATPSTWRTAPRRWPTRSCARACGRSSATGGARGGPGAAPQGLRSGLAGATALQRRLAFAHELLARPPLGPRSPRQRLGNHPARPSPPCARPQQAERALPGARARPGRDGAQGAGGRVQEPPHRCGRGLGGALGRGRAGAAGRQGLRRRSGVAGGVRHRHCRPLTHAIPPRPRPTP
jgi:hypothetical protein